MTHEDFHKPANRASSKGKQPSNSFSGAATAEAFSEAGAGWRGHSCRNDANLCPRLTDRIKAGVSDVAEMLHRAHEGGAWSALGYPSWAEYCKAEFEMSPAHSYSCSDFVEIKNELAKSPPLVVTL